MILMNAAAIAGRILDFIYAACARIAEALLVVLCCIVVFSIAARLFGLYGGGATDIASYAMAAATFLALAPAFRAGAHIYVSFVAALLPSAHRRRLSLFAHLMMFLAAALLAFYLSRHAYFSFLFEERSEGADAILLWIPQAPVAFGATLFAIAVLHSGVEIAFGNPHSQNFAKEEHSRNLQSQQNDSEIGSQNSVSRETKK